MGARKRLMAEKLKEAKKVTAIAKANNIPTSPRKMRLVADTVRGVEVNRALDLLKFSKRAASKDLEVLLRSAIANWEAKNPDQSKELDNGNVYVKTIMVGEGRPHEGHPRRAAHLPRRESLGAEAPERRALAAHVLRLARPLAEVTALKSDQN